MKVIFIFNVSSKILTNQPVRQAAARFQVNLGIETPTVTGSR
jgi:hypothetical protein